MAVWHYNTKANVLGHLFTFSRLREDEVGGEMLRAIKTPSISFAHLQVTNGYNIWQLPIKDCESWAVSWLDSSVPKMLIR